MAVFAESLEARCQVENEDVVGAAPTGDAPTTSEWSTILLSTKARLVLEILRYLIAYKVGEHACIVLIVEYVPVGLSLLRWRISIWSALLYVSVGKY